MKAFILVLAFCGFVGFSHAGEGAFLAEGAPSTFKAIGAAAVSRSATVEDCEACAGTGIELDREETDR